MPDLRRTRNTTATRFSPCFQTCLIVGLFFLYGASTSGRTVASTAPFAIGNAISLLYSVPTASISPAVAPRLNNFNNGAASFRSATPSWDASTVPSGGQFLQQIFSSGAF